MQRTIANRHRTSTPEFRSLALALFYLLLGLAALTADSPRLTSEQLDILRRGDTAELRRLLDSGVDVNSRDDHGNTMLMLSAVYSSPESMALLLERGASVNAANGAGATALMRAASDTAKIQLLLEHRADVHARSALGNTALLLAARPPRSHNAVKLLLAHGADARTTNSFGATPLMAAAAGGDIDSVTLLLDHGADPNAQPSPSEEGFLFGGGRSALMWAAFRGDTNLVKVLLAAGAKVDDPGSLGTPLAQAAWNDHAHVAKILLDHGASPAIPGPTDGYQPLHWAASTEHEDATLVKLLIAHGADPNAGGGENVDAFMGTPQTPLMLAKRRGDTAIVHSLQLAGATRASADRTSHHVPGRTLPDQLDDQLLREAVNRALPPLHNTSIRSKENFLVHSSKQDCTSCHQQHLPMAAIGLARKFKAQVDPVAEQALINIVREGEIKEIEFDWQPLFHPDPVMTKGYELLAYAGADVPPDNRSDAWIHHLASIQGADGRWFNNLPRPPIQTGDIGATALAVHALQRFPLPGRKLTFEKQVNRARQWLWNAKANDTDSLAYQLLGLAWAGESPSRLQSLSQNLIHLQRQDGGWAQLPKLQSDAYATGQAIYALRVAAGFDASSPAVTRGLRFLLSTQLDDGTWHVRRRAFPFQPTMDSAFPHGRDGWISAAGTSWAVMAISTPDTAAH